MALEEPRPQICLTLPDCWPLQSPLACRDIPDLQCLGVDDLAASEIKPGGRTIIVTPYDLNDTGYTVCSGQYGQWQVLTGLGGQINRGLFVGNNVKKSPASYGAPGVSAEIDLDDCVKAGDRCIAVRDRGRWYVTRLGGAGSSGGVAAEVFSTAIVYGGNTPETVAPFGVDKVDIYALDRFPTPKNPDKAVDWTKLDLPLNFAHDAVIPAQPNTSTFTWPRGVGLARLARGSPAVGGSAWDADLDPVPPLVNVPAKPLKFFTKRLTNANRVYCYFDKPSLTAADYTKITVSGGKTVTSATISGPVLTLNVTPSITSVDVSLPLVVTFLSKAISVCTDLSTGGNVYLAPQAVNVSAVDNDSPIAVPDVKIRGAVIEPSTLDKIKVSMSGPVDTTASTAGWTLSGGAPALTISSVAVTDGAEGVITLTLNRAITVADLAGVIEVSHAAAITTQTAVQTASPTDIPAGPCIDGGPLAAVFKAARSTYVLVTNRYTERDYRQGDVIEVVPTSYIDVEDTQTPPNVRRCYDTRIVETATRPSVYVARIIGGNTLTPGGAGIKAVSAAPTVATVIDPYADPTLADGVGYGYLFKDGVQQFADVAGVIVPTRVVLQHANSSVRFGLLAGEYMLLGKIIVIAGAGKNSAYPIAGF